MTGRYSNPLKLDKEMNIQDIAEYYSNRLIKEENRSKALILREISNDIQFEDRKGTIYDLKGIWYKPWQYDQLMFIAAHIIDVNQYRKHFFHLLCEYEDSGTIYKGCFVVPEDRYLEAYENNVNHCLIGTCIRKKQKAVKYSYNRYAHYGSSSEVEERKITKMLNFYLL